MSPVVPSSARPRGTRGATVGRVRRPGLFSADLLLRQALVARQVPTDARGAALGGEPDAEEARLTLGVQQGVRRAPGRGGAGRGVAARRPVSGPVFGWWAGDCPGGPRRFHPRADSAKSPDSRHSPPDFARLWCAYETNSPTVNHLQSQTVEVEIGAAFASGVPVAFGSDTIFPHATAAREFAVMVGLGLSPENALRAAATTVAARTLGLEDEIGRLAPGYAADLIAVADNPLEDIRTMENVLFVMRSGRIVKMLGSK